MTFIKRVTESAKSLSEGAKTGAKNIVGRSSDLVESTKLKYEMSKLEKEVENNISALGNLVYLQFKGGEDHEEEIKRLLSDTRTQEEEIAKLAEQIEKLKPKPPVCPKCNTEYPPAAKFCMNCGEKIEQEAPPAQETPPAQE